MSDVLRELLQRTEEEHKRAIASAPISIGSMARVTSDWAKLFRFFNKGLSRGDAYEYTNLYSGELCQVLDIQFFYSEGPEPSLGYTLSNPENPEGLLGIPFPAEYFSLTGEVRPCDDPLDMSNINEIFLDDLPVGYDQGGIKVIDTTEEIGRKSKLVYINIEEMQESESPLDNPGGSCD